jgi:hypothetical protein
VGPFIAEASSSLHEIEVAVVFIVAQQVILHLQVHFFQFNVDALYFLQQGLVLDEFLLLTAYLFFLHLGEVDTFEALPNLAVDFLVGEALQISADLEHSIPIALSEFEE